MSYSLPKGYLSPSQLNTWERCQLQYKTFVVEGNKAPPDYGLQVKIQTHETILEGDLANKIKTGSNLKNSELQEQFIAGLEGKTHLMQEDPNLKENVEKIVETEATYFAKIVTVTEPWRVKVKPKSVEQRVQFTLGEIPIEGYYDLLSDEGPFDLIQDLKRQGKAPSQGSAKNSRQLATYAMGLGVPDVQLTGIVENVTPKVVTDTGQISQGLVERVKAQYEGIAGEITDAIEQDRWVPVDTTDNRKAWVCTAQYCGAYRIGAKDWKTGKEIACPYGERAQVKVYTP